MSPLLALSIQQPWADMIVRGVKTLELRDWEMKHRGPIALHTSRKVDFPTAYLYGYWRPWTLPLGRLVAVAEVMDVITFGPKSKATLLKEHRQLMPIQRGTYGIVLRNVRPVQPPIEFRGQPLLFPLPNDITQLVMERVARSRQ